MIRAKFTVTQVTRYETPGYATITMEARYSKSIPEDQRFHQYTPNGKLTFDVTNPAVVEQMQPGKVFYLDFTEAPEGTPAFHE